MKNSNTITEIMIGDHALIEILLSSFIDNLGKDKELAEKTFEEFRWGLEKHIFVEERVIFNPCERLESNLCEIAMALAKEHTQMMDILNKMKEDLATGKEIDVSEFQKLLTAHRDVEEKNLYPELDKQLSQAQKEVIIARINEIPMEKDIDF